MIDSKILNEAVTQDFNDMRTMLYEMEQALVAVDPLRQMRHYQLIQSKIFEALEDALDTGNILLYPDIDPKPINLN